MCKKRFCITHTKFGGTVSAQAARWILQEMQFSMKHGWQMRQIEGFHDPTIPI